MKLIDLVFLATRTEWGTHKASSRTEIELSWLFYMHVLSFCSIVSKLNPFNASPCKTYFKYYLPWDTHNMCSLYQTVWFTAKFWSRFPRLTAVALGVPVYQHQYSATILCNSESKYTGVSVCSFIHVQTPHQYSTTVNQSRAVYQSTSSPGILDWYISRPQKYTTRVYQRREFWKQ